MHLEIRLPGGDRVEALSRGKTIVTDQDGSAPQPFELFMDSPDLDDPVFVRFEVK